MRLAGIIEESIVDGPGIRTAIFFQGCPHHCPGCHNAATHDFSGGHSVELNAIDEMLRRNTFIDGVTFSGGDPLASIDDALSVARLVKQTYGLNLWIYTGYIFEEIYEKSKKDKRYFELLTLTDVIVDGPYIASLRDISLPYRGSGNQRLIDVVTSLELKETVVFKI